jgi:hypothetical protein
MNEQFHTSPNPELSSIREESLELIQTGYDFKDKNTGESFYLINKHPENQRFISLALKGVINVADIVEYKGRYFSHGQNIDHLDSNGDYSTSEINADKFIFRMIFGDNDHAKAPRSAEPNKPNEWETQEYNNIMVDKNSDKKYYFDFDDADIGNYSIYNDRDTAELLNKNFSDEEIIIINQKAKTALDLLFNESHFNAFKSIVIKSKILEAYKDAKWRVKYGFIQSVNKGKEDDESRIREMFEDFQERFELVYGITTEKISSLKKETSS